MFLYELKNTEKECLFNLIKILVFSDKNKAESEVNFLDDLCREMEMDVFDIEPRELDEIYLVFRNASYRTKKIALLELLYAAYADGHFNHTEYGYVYDFVDAIGLEGRDVVKQRENVAQYVKVMKDITDELNY